MTSFGFAQGPGQALTLAKIWEAASPFSGLSDFALAGSAMGYAVAIIVGVFLMNIIARKKGIDTLTNPSKSEECGYYDECDEIDEAGKVTTSPSNIDVFAWHIALGLGVYFLTTAIAIALVLILPPKLAIFVWSLFFIMCSTTAICTRLFIVKIGKKRLICNGVTSRISNTLVDFLVCATFISIQVGNINQYVWPYIFSCLALTLTTAAICWFYCRKLEEDGPETFAFIFGTYTGTISTGFILLRMIDPESKSQVPVNMALSQVLLLPITVLTVPLTHLEMIYGFPISVLIAANIAFALVFAAFLYLIKIPKTLKAWQSD